MSTGHYPLQAALNRSLPATRTTTLLSTITLRQHVVRNVITFSPKTIRSLPLGTLQQGHDILSRTVDCGKTWENMGKYGKTWDSMAHEKTW